MKIVVAYKWTRDPEEATVRPDGTVDWSRAKPGLSAYDPVAIEVARQLADETGAELIGVTVGDKGVGAPLACKAALGRGLDRVVIVEDGSLADAGRSELAAVLAEVIRHIGDVDLVVTGDSSMDVAAKMVPDRAGRRARLAGRCRGHLGGRQGGRAARRARGPGRRAGPRDLRSCRAGRPPRTPRRRGCPA